MPESIMQKKDSANSEMGNLELFTYRNKKKNEGKRIRKAYRNYGNHQKS